MNKGLAMKTIARIALAVLFTATLSAASAPVSPVDSFEQVSSVTTTETITVSGSVGINL